MELLNTLKVKWIASQLGLKRLIIKNKKCVGYFLSDKGSEFFQSEVFNKVLLNVQNHSQFYSIREKETRNGNRLLLTVNKINSIEDLKKRLEMILKSN